MSKRWLSRRGPALALVTMMVLALALAGGGAIQRLGDDQGSVKVVAVFDNAATLHPGQFVRLAGVQVGSIESITLHDGMAHVEMSLDPSVLPLHTDATAVATTAGVLGDRYITLKRGAPSSPLMREPRTINNSHTQRPVELEDVLNTVDNRTGVALAALVTSLGEGVQGRGPDIAAAIKSLTPAMTNAHKLANILSDQNAVLNRVVDGTAPVAQALGGQQGQRLDHLVQSGKTMLSAVAADRREFAQTIQRLPDTIKHARLTLARVAGVSTATRRTLASLRPVTEDLRGTSGETTRFADVAEPALTALPPVLHRGQQLLDQAAPVVRTLRQTGPDLRGVAGSARPLFEKALSSNLTNLMDFIKGWALSTSGYDAVSHYFRATVPLAPKPSAVAGLGPVPGAPKDPAPDLSPPVPQAPTLPLPGAETGSRDRGPKGSATGLTQQQESNMIDQLLGGL